MKYNTPVVNLFGGPGTGKSTTMAGTFYELKCDQITAEMSPEWFKGKVWEGTAHILATDQLYISAKQNHKLHQLMNTGVQVVITDCPLLMGLVYAQNESEYFKAELVDKFMEYNNINIFLRRVKNYDPHGRMQTEAEARGIDVQLKEILDYLQVPYMSVQANREAPKVIAEIVKKQL